MNKKYDTLGLMNPMKSQLVYVEVRERKLIIKCSDVRNFCIMNSCMERKRFLPKSYFTLIFLSNGGSQTSYFNNPFIINVTIIFNLHYKR